MEQLINPLGDNDASMANLKQKKNFEKELEGGKMV